MAVVYHEIYLPIDTESTFDYIVIKQGDAGTHKVRATLISNNRVYTIPTSGDSYFMKFRKPDNNYCLVEATVSDNTISAEVTEEMLRVSGTGRGEFMIVSGSNELKTATFHVKIVKETYTSEDVQSHSDFAPFAALLQGAGAAASNANTAAAAANAAASLAAQKAQAIPDDYSDLVAEVEEVKAELDNLEPGLSDTARAALLACVWNVSWTTTDGQDHYVALENALCVTNHSISNGLIKITSDGLSGWGCSDGHGNKNTGQPFAGVATPSYPRNRLYTDKGKTLAWADEYWAENGLHAEGTYLIPVPPNKRTVTITTNPSADVYYALTSYGYNNTTEQYGNRLEDSGWVASGNSYTLNSGAKYIAPLVKYTSGGREQLPNFTDVTIVFS